MLQELRLASAYPWSLIPRWFGSRFEGDFLVVRSITNGRPAAPSGVLMRSTPPWNRPSTSAATPTYPRKLFLLSSCDCGCASCPVFQKCEDVTPHKYVALRLPSKVRKGFAHL